eukprot:364256-Chlamydomonas_euryale.AAC.10
MLEELGVEYDAWKIPISGDEPAQFSSGFVAVNPNSKIPAMVDHTTSPPQNVFESCHMLLYLAEKYGKFLPKDFAKKTECLNVRCCGMRFRGPGRRGVAAACVLVDR